MPRSNTSQTPAVGNQNVQRTQATQNPLQGEQRCFTCGEKGHFANQCSNLRSRPPQTVVSTPTVTRGVNSVPIAARQNFVRGKVNHVIVEEAQTRSLVHFPSTTSLQLCCLILEHHILSYPLHMLRSIIYP
jgi:hypothetical protein